MWHTIKMATQTNLQKYFSKQICLAQKMVQANIATFLEPVKGRENNENVIYAGGKWLRFVCEGKLHYNLQINLQIIYISSLIIMNDDFNLKSSFLYFLGATISSPPGKKRVVHQ